MGRRGAGERIQQRSTFGLAGAFLAGQQIAIPVDVEPGGFRRRKPRLIGLCNCAEAVPSTDCDAGHEMAGKAFDEVLAGGIVEPLVHERRGEGL